MQKFKLFLPLFLVLLLAGCATKEMYRFGAPVGHFNDFKKVKKQELPAEDINASEPLATAESTAAENIVFNASLEPNNELAAIKARPIQQASVQPKLPLAETKKYAIKSFRQSLKKQIKSDRKIDDEPAGKKPIHRLARIGFILSLAGILLHIVGLTILGVGGGYLVLGFFTAIAAMVLSLVGRKRIKENPEQYAGKGLALAGFLIGALQVLFYIIFLLAAIAWAAAYV